MKNNTNKPYYLLIYINVHYYLFSVIRMPMFYYKKKIFIINI